MIPVYRSTLVMVKEATLSLYVKREEPDIVVEDMEEIVTVVMDISQTAEKKVQAILIAVSSTQLKNTSESLHCSFSSQWR